MSSGNEWINQLWHIQTMEHLLFSNLKKMSYGAMKNRGTVNMLIEKKPTEKATNCMSLTDILGKANL